MDQERIGKFIAKCRKEKKMTQQELADKLRVTDRAIGNWENGRRLPDYGIVKDLCKELGISINELFAGEYINEKNIKEKTDEVLTNTIDYSNKKIKKIKKYGIIAIILFIISIFILTFSIDYNRIKQNKEPVFMVLISEKNSKYTYLGFGYKMIREVGVSPQEPLSSSQNIKFGFWLFTWDIKVFNTKPYNLWVINDNNRVLTEIGSYCITDTKGDYKSSACGDSIPIQDMKYKDILSASSNDIIAIDSNLMQITRVTFYDLNGTKILEIDSPEKYSFEIPKLQGEYLVMIDTISDRGAAWYSYKTILK